MHIEAAVLRKINEPLVLEHVDMDKPRGREIVVRTVATGVCHSDLHVIEGISRYPTDRPFVLGHEGAGIVEAVGPDVTYVKVGDHVVACLSGFCGTCPQCLDGHPNVCTNNGEIIARAAADAPRLTQEGGLVRQFGGIGSYAEKMLMHENMVVKIDKDIPFDRAALVGCGVLTGVGAALRSSGLQPGQTVAVFGAGGVGLSIIQGAKIGGARQIIAVDQFDTKLEMAKSVGAANTVHATQDDPGKKRDAEDPDTDNALLRIALAIGLGLGIAALLASPFLLIGLLKRRRRGRRLNDPLPAGRIAGAWAELADTATDLGTRTPATATRREVAAAVALAHPDAGVERIAADVDAGVFGAAEPTPEAGVAVWAAVDGAVATINGQLGPWRQIRGFCSIRSLRRRPGTSRVTGLLHRVLPRKDPR